MRTSFFLLLVLVFRPEMRELIYGENERKLQKFGSRREVINVIGVDRGEFIPPSIILFFPFNRFMGVFA